MGTRFGRQIVTMMIFALVFGGISIAPGSVALAAPVVDQQQTTIDTSVGGLAIGGSALQKLGQTVTAGQSGDLVRVDLPAACVGTADLIIEIRDVAANGTPGTTVKASTTITGSTIPAFFPAPPSFRAFTFTNPATVSAGGKFAIVLSSTGTTVGNNCAIFQGPVGDSYAGGDYYFDALPNAPGWIRNCGEVPNDRCDLPFKTWVEPAPKADLSMTKTLVNPNNLNIFAATEQFYQLTVTNAGPNTATGVTVVDTLPAGVTFLSGPPPCTNNAGTLTCSLGPSLSNLAAGSSFTIFIKVSFNNAGSYTNTATVSANETDPNTSNNTSSHTQQVLPTADLLVSQVTTTPAVAGPGDTFTYVATIKNLGPDPDGDVALVQTIPTGSTFASISSPDTTLCGQNLPNTSEYGCRFSGIPVGASRSMTVSVNAPNSAQALASTFVVSHVILAPPPILDPDLGNNSITVHAWVISESVQKSVTSGGTATTDTETDGATLNDPIETTVQSPGAGTVTITEQKFGSSAPTQWTVLGAEVVISAPAGTTSNPIYLTFRIDSSFLAQFTAATIEIFRNYSSTPVANCQKPQSLPPSSTDPISPDPCVWSRTTLGDGDVEILVLTSQASVWSFAIHDPFAFDGFAAPLRTGTNDAKAGSAVPLKFSLGGFQGMTILANGSPASREVSCATGAPLGQLAPAALNGRGLHYDETTDNYSLIWRTSKEWSGTCRDLVLTLIDGSDHVARFAFR